MEQPNLRNIFYIALSVFVAALTWFYVNNSAVVTISVEKLPVEFQNEESTLANRGLMLVNSKEVTVNLKLQMPRSLVFRLDPSEIRVVADLSSVIAAGQQSLPYTILYPSKISTRNITIESPAVRTVQVEIGELSRKDVELRCRVVGNVADGYTAGTPVLTPATLELRGQQEDLMRVNYAEVVLDIDNASATLVELLDYTLYDLNDQKIESSNIHPASSQIEVKLPVMTVKEIPLVVDFVETAGARLDSFSYALNYDKITISGDASVVNSINTITLGTLALEDLQADETFVYDIVLPSGVNNLSGLTSVTLTISQSDMMFKELIVTNFTYQNAAEGNTVTIVTTSLPVTLRGKQADIDAITEENVTISADLSDVADAYGSYTVPAKILVDGYDIGSVGSYEVNVHIGPMG